MKRVYDPAISPPRAIVIYIGSDLPILCITRAQIVISLRASEAQSSGMAGARSDRDIPFSLLFAGSLPMEIPIDRYSHSSQEAVRSLSCLFDV